MADKKNEKAKQTRVQVQLQVNNIFVRNVSLEFGQGISVPVFGKAPALDMELRNSTRFIQNNQHEVILDATIRIREEDKVIVLVEVQQAGVFTIGELATDDLQRVLNVNFPEILYPYLSHTITDLLYRASVPRIFLPPFNFHDLYKQKLEKQSSSNSNVGHA